MNSERNYPETIEFSSLRTEYHLRTRRYMRTQGLRFIPDAMLEALINDQKNIDTTKPIRVILDKDNEFVGLSETRRDQNTPST